MTTLDQPQELEMTTPATPLQAAPGSTQVLAAARLCLPTRTENEVLDSLEIMHLLVQLETEGLEPPDPQLISEPTIAGVAAAARR